MIVMRMYWYVKTSNNGSKISGIVNISKEEWAGLSDLDAKQRQAKIEKIMMDIVFNHVEWDYYELRHDEDIEITEDEE